MATLKKPMVVNGTVISGAKRIAPEHILPKTFAAVGGAPTYPAYSPVAFNTATSKWVIWNNGGLNNTNIIEGFLAEEHTVDATSETLANVIFSGILHRNDIPVPAGQTQNDLDAALRASTQALREKGFIIQGISSYV